MSERKSLIDRGKQIKPRTWLLCIFLVGLLIRLTWAYVAPNLDPALKENPLYGDAAGYHTLAVNLLAGAGFSWDGILPTSYRMPGYPLFLASIYSLTHNSLPAVRFLQAVLSALTLLPVYAIARRLGGERTGLLAAAGVAFQPIVIYLSTWLYSETLYFLFCYSAIWLMIESLNSNKRILGILAGILFGICVLIRPELLPYPTLVVLLGIMLKWPKKQLWLCGLVQLVVLIVLVPWSIRNSQVHDNMVLLTTSGGSNFFAGNNPNSNGGSAWSYPLEGLTEIESDQELLQRSMDWIKQNPKAEIALLPKKLYKFFSPVSFETNNNSITKWGLPVTLVYFCFLIIAAWGGWISRRSVAGAALLALCGLYVLVALIFYGGTRVALPITPALVIFAAYAIDYYLRKANFRNNQPSNGVS